MEVNFSPPNATKFSGITLFAFIITSVKFPHKLLQCIIFVLYEVSIALTRVLYKIRPHNARAVNI